MTRIKTILKNVEVLDVKKVKSKRGNDYQVLTIKDESGQEVNLYDPNIFDVELNKFYDFDGIQILYTSQRWHFVDKNFRSLSFGCYDCKTILGRFTIP